MKKWLIVIIMAILISSLSGMAASAASLPSTFVSVILDGKKIWFPDAQAFIDKNQRTMVPVRFVAESLGAKVGWENQSQSVPIDQGDRHIRLQIGSNIALVNGQEIALDTQAVISGDECQISPKSL